MKPRTMINDRMAAMHLAAGAVGIHTDGDRSRLPRTRSPGHQSRDTSLFSSWEDLAARGLMAITDDGAQSIGQYSAIFLDGDVLSFNAAPSHLLGFSQWASQSISASAVAQWIEAGETLISEPPDWMQQHLLSRINESYGDAMRSLLEKGMTARHAREQILDECFTYAPLEQSASSPQI